MNAVRYKSTKDLSREDWLEARRHGIGSSDAAVALGFSKWKTPAELYDELVGVAAPPDLSGKEAVELGVLLEDDVAELYERRTGRKLERVHAILQHPQHIFMLANLDRKVVGERRLVECKTAGLFAHKFGDWGDPETEPDRIPTEYLIQVQHQLAITGYDYGDLALLVGGQKFMIYPDIVRDEEFCRNMIELETKFWERVVNGRAALAEVAKDFGLSSENAVDNLTGRRMDLEASVATQLAAVIEGEINKFRPDPIRYDEAIERYEDKSFALEANESAKAAFFALEQAKADEAAAKERVAAAQLDVANFLREADTLTIDDKPVLTWRAQVGKRFDTKAHAAESPGCHAQFLKETASRVMRVK
jgi:putative phage-type endonuclease